MGTSSYTLLEIINIIGFRTRKFTKRLDDLATPTIETYQMIEAVNTVFRKMAKVKGLPSLNGSIEIPLIPVISTGTVSVLQGEERVQGDNTLWTDTTADGVIAGRYFSVKYGKKSLYKITSFIEEFQYIGLDRPFAEEDGSSLEYYIVQDSYNLPGDFADLISVALDGSVGSRTLGIMSTSDFEFQRYQMDKDPPVCDTPMYCTVFSRSGNAPNEVWQLKIQPFPSATRGRLIIKYRKQSPRYTENDSGLYLPFVDEAIDILIDGAVACWRKITGVEGGAIEFAAWEQGDLMRFASFDRHKTDETARLEPEDVMRGELPSRTTSPWLS